MSIEHRYIDRDEYRCRYRWRDTNGKLKNSRTGWFPSIREAEKNAAELKTAKEAESTLSITNKRSAYLITVLQSLYLPELEQRAHRITTDMTTTDVNKWRGTRTIIKYHTPEEIKYTKVSEITPRTFRIWVNSINDKELAGATIDRYVLYITNFNKWLADKGYYTDPNLDMNIQIAIDRIDLKSRKIGARKDRYLLGTDDIAKVVAYYREKGLGVFKNFYFYTLFYTLFYTGMRPEEAIALQWKNVDLRPEERIIYIRNAISQQEKECNAIERTKKGIYYTKNFDSQRGIPIFDVIYNLLVDYKESYKYASGLDNIDNCFVFPRELKFDRFDWNMFDGPGYWLLEYKEALRACNIPNSDVQMLRHSAATFLVAPEPDGLGFTEEQVMSFMGHIGPNMLKTVYAKLQQQQKTTKMKTTFADYYHPSENKRDKKQFEAKERAIKRFKGNSPEQQEYARKTRIIGQISNCIARGQETYYYTKEDQKIIDSVRDKFNIRFVLDDNNL